MDIKIGNKPAGRLRFLLRADIVPMTVGLYALQLTAPSLFNINCIPYCYASTTLYTAVITNTQVGIIKASVLKMSTFNEADIDTHIPSCILCRELPLLMHT